MLWNEKRGHQLVTLKHIKRSLSPALFMLCQQMVHACRLAQILCRYQIWTELIE